MDHAGSHRGHAVLLVSVAVYGDEVLGSYGRWPLAFFKPLQAVQNACSVQLLIA
jgi:hypothetical protein